MDPIRYPNIKAATQEENVEQIKKYLYQLVDQINVNLELIERKITDNADK